MRPAFLVMAGLVFVMAELVFSSWPGSFFCHDRPRFFCHGRPRFFVMAGLDPAICRGTCGD
jgi:hypothetical protein